MSAENPEIQRLLSYRSGRMYRWRQDGTVEIRPLLGDWFVSKKRLAPGDRKTMRAEFMSLFKHADFELGGSQPSIEEIEAWTFDGVCETPDGCRTEPDGSCPHGFKSWLLLAGLI